MEISRRGERQDCWKSMAAALVARDGVASALKQVEHLGIAEAETFYLKGWAKAVPKVEATPACLREALPLLAADANALEDLLQSYAVREAVFGQPAPATLQRLNRSLNIQWLMDITAQFPRPSGPARLSTNLDGWLHTVSDEDDRAQIELWARQVAKGKMTEEEFGARLADLA